MTIEEDVAALAEYEAEARWVTKEYQPLIDHYEAVERRNREVERYCREIMRGYESDISMGDC